MTAATRHQLVSTTVLASNIVVEKAASANPDQVDILNAMLPVEGQTKLASLARVIAAADLVDEPAE